MSNPINPFVRWFAVSALVVSLSGCLMTTSSTGEVEHASKTGLANAVTPVPDVKGSDTTSVFVRNNLPERMGNLIAFYTENGLDPRTGAYFSEIDNRGKVVSDKIYTVALSRLIYAMAYSSEFFPQNLPKARAAVDFQLNNMLGEDEFGPYFLSWFSETHPDVGKELDIWQQAYGLCGLVELYRQTKDASLLLKIHQLHIALVKRFQDKQSKGFVAHYTVGEGQEKDSKSLQSLMYPITAYLVNLWLADESNRSQYQPLLEEHIRMLASIGWDHSTGWVNVKFDENWQACKHEPDNICNTVSPGHNFQLAALFLRASHWPFVSEKHQRAYRTLGESIVDVTLDKFIYNEQGIQGGFARAYNPLTNQSEDRRKSWWQHCEALIALSLANNQNEKRDKLLNFFMNHFFDRQFGGEYFLLDAKNQPHINELKGSIGKSAYHTTEMIRFMR